MPGKPLKKIIESYCTARGIAVPAGFGRHPASRYVVIRRDGNTPKLVAKTWFALEDVVYYLEHLLLPELGGQTDAFDVLDFTDLRRLHYRGSSRLEVVGSFTLEP
ncbi:hypothetical protein [Prosthecobacter sp.]|uniref:hypothetical protein n=1 Tax=Prosthecobacter sp. TaxID=1965333 RepID=UPI003784A301